MVVHPIKSTGQADEASLRHALWGLPAVFAMGGILVLIVAVLLIPESRLTHRYSDMARLRLQAGDYQGAQECYRRLLQYDVDESEIRYRLALTEWGLGHQNKATKMMASLAAPDRTGYGPAHLWWARRFLVAASEGPSSSAAALENAERHLRRALEHQPENADAHALLGQLCLASSRGDEAVTHLRRAAQVHPEVRLSLAQAYQAVGKRDLAESEARGALAYFQRMLEAQRQNHAARKECAQLSLFLKDFEAATTLLREGLARSETEGYQPALAAAFAAWAKHLAQSATPEAALAPVIQGLQYDPASEELLQQLLAYCQQTGAGAAEIQRMLQASSPAALNGPALYLVLAVESQQQGDLDQARRHYETVHQAAPHVAVVANNLAWLLAHTEPIDLPRALTLATAIVERFPLDIEYRDTRAHILVRMGRWEQARTDVETIVAARPYDLAAHRWLADIYERLGMYDQAEQTRRRAGD